MMSDAPVWESAVRDQVRLVAGNWLDEATAAWTAFAAEPRVQITLYGGYDTGKTSLIKRFLVEDGTTLSDGLIVGAKPTSYETLRVASGDLVYVDTPGRDSGNTDHEAHADGALLLADAVLLVLSPQLLSGGLDVVRQLVDGTFFNSMAMVPQFADGSLIVAVSQMDTAGVSPWDDTVGYRRLIERKRSELSAALGGDARAEAYRLHFIAADPDEAGQADAPSREDYSGREDWDGIAELRTDLQSLTERQAEVRIAASIRYWCWVGDQARRRAEHELQLLNLIVDEARRSEEVLNLLLEEIDHLDLNARTSLGASIYEVLIAGATLTDRAPQYQEDIEQRLNSMIVARVAEWSGQLDRLARRAATEQRVRAERPSARALRVYLDELFADHPLSTASGPSSVDDLLKRLDWHARSAARAGYGLFHGMSVEQARNELSELRDRRIHQLERHYEGADGREVGTEHPEDVRISPRRLATIEAVRPIAMELDANVSKWSDQQRDGHRAELRSQLRRLADKIANEIAADTSVGCEWSRRVTGFREAVVRTEVTPDLAARFDERRAILTDAVKQLTDLLVRAGLD